MTTYAFLGQADFANAIEPRLREAGFQRLADAAAADVVLTYFLLAEQVEDAYFDEQGLVKRAKPGAVLIDLSPVVPSLSRELYAIVSQSGAHFVEAPVLFNNPVRSDAFAAENMSCLVAGEEADLAAAQDVLDALVGSYSPTGESGSASLARAVYTIQQMSAIVAVTEAEGLFRAACESGQLVPKDKQGPGAISPLGAWVLVAVDADEFEGDYSIEICMAEVMAALAAADEVGVSLPYTEGTLQMLQMLAAAGGIDNTPAMLGALYRTEDEIAQLGLNLAQLDEHISATESFLDDLMGLHDSDCADDDCFDFDYDYEEPDFDDEDDDEEDEGEEDGADVEAAAARKL